MLIDAHLPSMTKVDKVKPHKFTVNDVTYEWIDGAYYKHAGDIR